MRPLLAVLAVGLSVTLPAGVPDEGSIEDFVDIEMPASSVPGLAYAVVADGEITEVGAHGVVEIGDDREVTLDTPFVTGSISKSFTALAVMQLVEAGEVDLDTGISTYLDGFFRFGTDRIRSDRCAVGRVQAWCGLYRQSHPGLISITSDGLPPFKTRNPNLANPPIRQTTQITNSRAIAHISRSGLERHP